jgi:hypothetical protein
MLAIDLSASSLVSEFPQSSLLLLRLHPALGTLSSILQLYMPFNASDICLDKKELHHVYLSEQYSDPRSTC